MAKAGFLVARQVNLRNVAGDHRLRVEADARQEHLHLFDGGVLALIENDKCVVQGAAAHIGQRRDLNHVAFDQLLHALEAQHFEQGVVQRAQVRIDLLAQIPRQEAQFFTGFNRRARQQNAANLLAFQGIYRSGDGQIGFPGTGRPNAEGDVVIENIGDVLRLIGRARFHHAALGFDGHRFAVIRHAVGYLLKHPAFFDRQMDLFRVDIRDHAANGCGVHVQVAQYIGGGHHARVFANQLKTVVTAVDLDPQPAFDLFDIVIKWAAQAEQSLIVCRL